MAGRNIWLVAVLVLAIVFPYYLSGDAQWSSLRGWWDSMWTDTVDGGQDASRPGTWLTPDQTYPVASATPAPPSRPFNFATPQSVPPQNSTARMQATTTQPWPLPGAVAANAGNPASAVYPGTEAQDPLLQQPSLCGPSTPSISYLLNFEATPAWVMNNWRRVSTRLAEFDLEGLRVPVVTGTAPDDMVGSLTYYFDARQVLQRITFDGYTGDPAPLTAVMMQQYGMHAEPWLGAGLYLARRAGPVEGEQAIISVLRIRHAPVVRVENPRQRYDVEFELNRPDNELGLSSYYTSLLEKDRERNVWQPAAETTPETEKDEAAVEPAADETATTTEGALKDENGPSADDTASEVEPPKHRYPSKSQLPINADRYLPPPF